MLFCYLDDDNETLVFISFRGVVPSSSWASGLGRGVQGAQEEASRVSTMDKIQAFTLRASNFYPVGATDTKFC